MSLRYAPAILALLLGLVSSAVDRAHGSDRPAVRRSLSDQTRYYVIFCARKSRSAGSGHAFVVWVARDGHSGRTQVQRFGFYPGEERVVFNLFAGNGKMVDESTKAASTNPELLTHRLVVPVDEQAFAASLDVKTRWENAEYDYNLFVRNCTHFTYEVVRAIGQDAPRPAFGELPLHYLDRLADAVHEAEEDVAWRAPAP